MVLSILDCVWPSRPVLAVGRSCRAHFTTIRHGQRSRPTGLTYLSCAGKNTAMCEAVCRTR